MIGICMSDACFPKTPYVMRRELRNGKASVYVGPLRESDRPADIVVVPDMTLIEAFVEKPVTKYKKVEQFSRPQPMFKDKGKQT